MTEDAYPDDLSVSTTTEQVATELEEEVVVLQLEAGTYYGIDGIGPFVWDQLQEPVTVAELCERVAREYDIELQRARRDIEALLADLEDAQLLDRRDD